MPVSREQAQEEVVRDEVPTDGALVDDFAVDDLVVEQIQMGDFQGAHCLDGERERLVGIALRLRLAQPLACGPERAQHLRAIEPLPLTMVTETHRRRPLLRLFVIGD
jgi:hypothetical protein